jgi:hypothetical protein
MPASDSIGGAGQRGQIMLALLVAAILVTVISVSLVSIMNTDMSHASIQYAVARSYYIAQAGLEEAKAHIATAADPAADATPPAGVTAPYGGGQFTYWVDAGPATGCEPGLKTLEALGQVAALGRRIPARVQACAAPGALRCPVWSSRGPPGPTSPRTRWGVPVGAGTWARSPRSISPATTSA